MKILVIKFRNIGDVLLSTSLIENLKLNYPDATIDCAINSNCKDMLTYNPHINEIFLYERSKIKLKGVFGRIYEEIKYIKNIVKHDYDIVINLTEGDRGALITLFSGAKIKLGFKPRKGILKYLNFYNYIGDDKQLVHTVEKDLQFINLLNKNILNKKVSIGWSSEDENKIDQILNENRIKSFVHIHPVSRWMFKCWEDERMAAIIDYFELEKKLKVIITASNEKKEKDRVEKILNLCKSKPINLTGQLSLKELACLSSKSKLFFGIDSAPMHIAAAVDTPIVSLMGGSEPIYWGPWDNSLGKSNFKNLNGKQQNGKHVIISNIDHTIFYENNVKKCKGMTLISYEEVLKVISEKV